jgi:hypothetical protein
MATMNSYYAHETEVGPVFDVAHFAPHKAIFTGLIALGAAGLIGVVATYMWDPSWLISHPPKYIADAVRETKEFTQLHPQGVTIGVAIGAVLALVFAAAGVSCLLEAVHGDYYIRVGEGGLSLRLPDGFFGAFERDYGWDEIAKLTVVQEKYLGSMSQSAGNIGGEMRLRTHDGGDRSLRLDHFREDAWLIYNRIQEAQRMRTAVLAHDEWQ